MRRLAAVGVFVVMLVVGVVNVAAAQPAPPPPAISPQTLTGEFLDSNAGQPTGTTNIQCTPNSDGSGSGTFTSSGVAEGPYPGTFTEQGSFTLSSATQPPSNNHTVTAFTATFTINSGTMTITGSKSLSTAPPNGQFGGICTSGPGPGTAFALDSTGANYVAHLKLSTGATYSDHGQTSVYVNNAPPAPGRPGGFLEESFVSSQSSTTPLTPASISDCQGGKFQNFGFTNQGQCIKYVQQHGG